MRIYERGERVERNGDMISRQAAIDALQKEINKGIPPFDDVMGSIRCGVRLARNIIEDLPSAQPKRMSNREWVDFLCEQFEISRTSAKEMLHGMMRWKKEDNFKRQFSQGKSDLVKDLVNEQTEREGE